LQPLQVSNAGGVSVAIRVRASVSCELSVLGLRQQCVCSVCRVDAECVVCMLRVSCVYAACVCSCWRRCQVGDFDKDENALTEIYGVIWRALAALACLQLRPLCACVRAFEHDWLIACLRICVLLLIRVLVPVACHTRLIAAALLLLLLLLLLLTTTADGKGQHSKENRRQEGRGVMRMLRRGCCVLMRCCCCCRRGRRRSRQPNCCRKPKNKKQQRKGRGWRRNKRPRQNVTRG